jgi:hypothetical protein
VAYFLPLIINGDIAMATQVTGGANPPATVESTPTATLDAIAATLVSEKPEVQPHAIAQADAERAAAVGKDSQGNDFNPAIHAVNADGSPRKTMTGRYALKRGRKSDSDKSADSSTSAKGIVLPGGKPSMTAKEQSARSGGVGAANLLLMVSVGLGGDEWQPRKDEKSGLDEKAMLEQAFGDFFVAKGYEDLPPGWALVAALGMYAMPRFHMPKTQTRMQKLRAWIGAKIGAWKANRVGKRRGVPESDVERADREARELYAREKKQ